MKTGIFIQLGNLNGKFWEEEFNFAKELCVNHVELIVNYPYFGPSNYTQKQIRKIKNLADNLEILLHLLPNRYDLAQDSLKQRTFDLASFDKETRIFSIREVMKTYEIAKKLNAKLITVHGGYCKDKKYKEHLSVLKNSLEELNKKFKGVKLCVENLPLKNHSGNKVQEIPYYPEDLVYLIKDLENVGVTFDVGHANTITNPIDFYNKLTKIWNMHIHDNQGNKDDHLSLGKGNIDFKTFLKHLEDTSYKKYFTLELDIDWDNSLAHSQKQRKEGIEFLKKNDYYTRD